MAMRAHRSVTPSVKGLRVNDLLFIEEYLRNGRNATQAYRTAHPKSGYQSATVLGARVLGKVCVQAEIAKRIQSDGRITREFIQTRFLDIATRAQQHGDLNTERAAIADLADIAGLRVRKIEDVTERSSTLSAPERTSRIRALLQQTPPDSSPN